MRVIVVHEDGDKESRVTCLAGEICAAIANGSMRYQGVGVEIRDEMDPLTVKRWEGVVLPEGENR